MVLKPHRMNKLEQLNSMIRIVADIDDLAIGAKRAFHRNMNEDIMAAERFAEGIRLFSRDQEKFESRPVA